MTCAAQNPCPVEETNEKDFKYFSGKVFKYVDAIGLSEWDIVTVHAELDDEIVATCDYDIESMHAAIIFNTESLTRGNRKRFLKRVALHEVLHVLFAKFSYMARTGETGKDDVYLTSTKHEVINKVINMVNELSDEFE